MKQIVIIGCDTNLLFSDTSTQTDKNDKNDNTATCRFNDLFTPSQDQNDKCRSCRSCRK